MKKGTFFKAKNKSLTRYTLLRKVVICDAENPL